MAFKLFATYSYPDVSYSLLEEATGISRGSMVYYFKNKEGIFKAVLDAFFYGGTNVLSVSRDKRVSLTAFCDAFVRLYDDSIRRLSQYNIKNPSEARLNIERSAAQFMPGFKERSVALQREKLAVWEEVVENSRKSGELPEDTDVPRVANIYFMATMGFFYIGSQNPSMEVAEELKKVYDSLHEVVCRRVEAQEM